MIMLTIYAVWVYSRKIMQDHSTNALNLPTNTKASVLFECSRNLI